jgi:hypothetical protein
MANLSISESTNRVRYTLEMSEDELEIITTALDFMPEPALRTELKDMYNDLLTMLLKMQPDVED